MQNLDISARLSLIDRVSQPLRAIQLPLEKTKKAFQQARDVVKDFEKQKGMIKSLQDMNKEFAIVDEQLKKSQNRVQQFQEELAKTEQPSQSLINKLHAAERGLHQAQKRFDSGAKGIDDYRKKMQQAGVNVEDLANEEKRLASSLDKAKSSLEKQTQEMARQKQILKQLHSSTSKYQKLRNNAAMVAGASAAAIAVPVKAFSEAEEAATSLKVSMMDNTGKVSAEFKKINELANRLGTSLPGSTADFSNMMATLIQQGISADKILGGVGEASANLAVVMKMPFAEAAEFTAKMQDATKTNANDMLALMDTIQKSYYLGVDSTNMLSGFSKLSAGMKTVRMEGIGGAKALAPLLVMADQAAMSGESAGNAYSKIFKAMLDTANISKTLKGTGIQLDFTDGKGEFAGLENMYAQLDKLKGLSTEARNGLLAGMFGNNSEVIQALNLLVDKGKTGYDETIAKMEAQADLQQRVNAQLGTLTNLWDAAKGTFTSVMVGFGETLAPDIKNILGFITDLTNRIGDWAKAHPELASFMMKTIAVIAVLAAALAGISTIMLTIIGPMALLRASVGVFSMGGGLISGVTSGVGMVSSAIGKISSVIRAVSAVMMANPILALLALLAVLAYVIYKNWDTLGPMFKDLWDGLVAGVSYFIEWVANAWNGLVQAVINFANSLWANLGIQFDSGIDALIGIILAFSPIGLFMQVFIPVWTWLSGLGAKFSEYGSNLIEGLKNGILGKAQAVIGAITGIANRIKSAFTSPRGMDIHSPSRVFAGYGDYMMQGLNQGIISNQSPINTMLTTSNNLRNAIDTSEIRFDNRKPITAGMAGQGYGMQNMAQPQPITINIYTQPNQDEQAIARMVASEVAKQQHNSNALYDVAEAW